MLKRTIIVAVMLAIGQLAVLYIQRGYSLGTAQLPPRDLEQLPMRLGEWVGQDLEQDEHINEYLQARAGVDRIYRKSAGAAVVAHVVWTDDYVKVHFPQDCYRASGWEALGSKGVDIPCGGVEESDQVVAEAGTSSKGDFPAKILTFEQDGDVIRVLYWFQIGEELFFDRLKHRALRRSECWGKKEWPYMVKVMLQSSGIRAEDHLREVAGHIHTWIHDS